MVPHIRAPRMVTAQTIGCRPSMPTMNMTGGFGGSRRATAGIEGRLGAKGMDTGMEMDWVRGGPRAKTTHRWTTIN